MVVHLYVRWISPSIGASFNDVFYEWCCSCCHVTVLILALELAPRCPALALTPLDFAWLAFAGANWSTPMPEVPGAPCQPPSPAPARSPPSLRSSARRGDGVPPPEVHELAHGAPPSGPRLRRSRAAARAGLRDVCRQRPACPSWPLYVPSWQPGAYCGLASGQRLGCCVAGVEGS